MSGPQPLRFLRPYLSKDLSRAITPAYLRFFHNTRQLRISPKIEQLDGAEARSVERTSRPKGKEAEWPRLTQNFGTTLSIAQWRNRFESLGAGEKLKEEVMTIRGGRVTSVRSSGPSLTFVDVVDGAHSLQCICERKAIKTYGLLAGNNKSLPSENTFKRGDIISMCGYPYRTGRGELSIQCVKPPTLLSPVQHVLPKELNDNEARVRNRHLDMLINPIVSQTFRLRSHLVQFIRNFLLKDDFLEVQTPVIAGEASGAIAKPFTTHATEFPEKQLALRIAPELWLKRLLVGGMGRVFEIGPVFRNEGLDGTHNPEFTTCEFYKSFAELEEIMAMTEDMVSGIAQMVTELPEKQFSQIPKVPESYLTKPFKRLRFIQTIEEKLGEKLPDLQSDDATQKLITLFEKHSISPPSSPTLPRLLDRLASIYIEPLCEEPTFITYHPACMAPLSKSFHDYSTNQVVSARAELFIQEREIANMYEEENSPIEQRAKFIQQAKWRDDENSATLDESYIQALEFGLPPTGGFGCGIDRLVMLFTGSQRIGDVLPFGNLKNVVNLGNPAPRTGHSVEKKEG